MHNYSLFQSHLNPIASRQGERVWPEIMCFNPILIQLRDAPTLKDKVFRLCFNPILIQLRGEWFVKDNLRQYCFNPILIQLRVDH